MLTRDSSIPAGVARLTFLSAIFVIAVAGCELVNNEDAFTDLGSVGTISYSRHVQPILTQKCVGCHGGAAPDAGLDLSSWDGVAKGSSAGGSIVPFDADRSDLIRMVESLRPVVHPLDLLADTLTSEEVVFLKRWIDEGAKDNSGNIPSGSADSLLYVAAQDDAAVYVIDTGKNVVAAIVDLEEYGFSASAKPHHTAVEADGSFWYVSLIGEGLVLKFTRDNELVGQSAFETPGMLALHPTQDYLFVGRSLSAPSPPSSIGRITRSTMAIEELQVLFPRPHALVVDPSGDYVQTASLGQNQLMTVGVDGGGVDFTAVAGSQHAFVQHAVSASRDRMYTTTQLTNQVLVFDISTPTAPVEVGSVRVNTAPWHPVLTPDESELYFGNNGANTITILDLDQLTVEKVISGNGIALPHGSAVRGDGRYVYISNRNTDGTYVPRHDFGNNANVGTVVIVDTATQEIVKVLEVGRYAAGMSTR